MFENYSKCRIFDFSILAFTKQFENYSKVEFQFDNFGHFPPFFVLLKVTCLVTLFDRKLFLKTRQTWPLWAFLMNFCPLKL